LSDTDKERDESKVNSGFGKKVANWVGRDMVYPTNVLHMATECANRAHSAVFPVALPAWFIKLFTLPGDLVLDPFMGSGTTAVAAKSLGRDYVGIDMMEEYVREAEQRVQAIQPALADVMTYELPSEEASPDARQVYTLRLCEREDCDLS
jgi:DNA modification methylase